MQAPALPADEAARLADLRAFEILDSERAPAFDRLTALASSLFEVPIALISLVDEARQWFLPEKGLGAKETPRDISFCGHAIHDDVPLVVNDALQDVRFADNPMVLGSPDIRFYAGAPIITDRGHRIGTLCILDRKPRELSAQQRQVLADLASLVVDQLELRSARRYEAQETEDLAEALAQFPLPVMVLTRGIVAFINAAAERMLGYPHGELLDATYLNFVHPEEQAVSASVRESAEGKSRPTRTSHRRLVRKDGVEVQVDATLGKLRWRGEEAILVGMRDVTAELDEEAKRAVLVAEQRRQLELMLQVADVLPDGIVLFDAEFRCAYANIAVGEMLGLSARAIEGWTPDQALAHVASLTDDPAAVLAHATKLREVTEGAGPSLQVFNLVRPRRRVVRRTLHRFGSEQFPWMAVWNDITHDAVQLAEREKEASTDALTGLLNRRGIEAQLARALASGESSCVALFDVDHFKTVNDTHGHAVGDEVLKRVGAALADAARRGDFVGRWGGEEFLAVLRTDLEGARVFAERAREAIAALSTPAGKVTISIGLAAGGLAVDPVEAADARLYEAKRGGRNRVAG